MKKKRNLLAIISSILGCIAICGFSVFGLLTRSKEKVQSKATISTKVLFRREFSNSISYIADNGSQTNSVKLVFDGYYVFEGRLNDDNSLNTRLSYTFDSIKLYLNGSSVATSLTPSNYTYQGTWLGNNAGLYELKTSGILTNITTISIAFGLYLDGNVYQAAFGMTNPLTIGSDLYYKGVSSVKYTVFSFVYNGNYDQYALGYNDGKQDGYNDGYQDGLNVGNNQGYETGFQAGVDSQESVIQNAYSSGYSDGYEQGHSQDSTVATIFSGILQVAMVPVNFFLAIFNFEILGINLSAFIRAIFTVVLTIIVLKTVTGKGGGSSDN